MAVRNVQSSRDLRAFIDLPYRIYADDPLWAPPLRREVRALLTRRDNPFFEYGDAELFLAERDGAVVGRVAAITNRLHNETHRDRAGFFGFFECIDDPAVAGELLDAASAWCVERKHDRLLGPASYSLNHECGLLIDGFESPPMLLTPHNPRYYPALMQATGMRKAKDLWAYEVGQPERHPTIPDRLVRGVRAVTRRLGLSVRPIDLRDLEREAETIRRILNACWAGNWGFVPITRSEMLHLTTQLKPIVVPELVPILEKDGEPIGFAMAIPDLNHALRRNRAGRTLPGVLKILWSLWRGRIPRARILLLGVLPEYRGKGVDALLWQQIWSKTATCGFHWCEASWILEDNAAMNNGLQRMGFTHYKTYRIYERSL